MKKNFNSVVRMMAEAVDICGRKVGRSAEEYFCNVSQLEALRRLPRFRLN